MSESVGLDRPTLSETFWSLLGGEGGRLQGLTRGLGSHPALGGRGKIVFLCHAPCVTPPWKWSAVLSTYAFTINQVPYVFGEHYLVGHKHKYME